MYNGRFSTISLPLLFLLLLCNIFSPRIATAQAETMLAGADYDPITPPVPQTGDKPAVVEVFNFKCPHCFTLHPYMDSWSEKNHDKYDIASIPVFWGKQTDMPVRAFYAAEFLGKGALMKDAIFKANFEHSVNIESADELGFLAEEAGLNPEKFKSYLNSFGVSAKIAQAKVEQRKYGVHSTPTLVVNGKYRVSFGKHANGDHIRLFKIVETLAAQ
ncbi:MAG: thiol:disulfide interchange protein DsbA/DsbL [Magnetococcales bacterium]|nr:thiol:disulfide interchange protein DsbA/DsbL [Magnetococcales bacterium]